MKRYILTGTPGCGKTSILRDLELRGYFVVEEAATDIIAIRQVQGIQAPWEHKNFIDDIIHLQKQREMQVAKIHTALQFYDRSPICTYALAIYLNFKPSITLEKEMERLLKNHVYEKRVFFIENLGFLRATDARKISYEESLVFEKIHEETYAKFGFECIKIPLAPLSNRTNRILELV